MNTPKLRSVICTLVLLAATALAAAAIRVRGNLAGTVVSTPLSATQARLVVNLAGQLSHLGKTHTVFETVADFSGPVPVPVSSNVGVITAANGDQILFTQHWTAVPVGGTEYAVTAVVQAAGGTGRFAGISGTGSYVARLDLGTGAAAAKVEGNLIR
jgi:hypothetical protein